MSIASVPDAFHTRFYVYALLCRDGDGPLYVKFGRTTRLHQRMRQLVQGSPIPAEYFAHVEVKTANKQGHLERALHRHFKDRRTRGEWFKFDPKEDKRAFNDGWKAIFTIHLGAGKSWDKISVKALDRWTKQRRAEYLSRGIKNKSREVAARKELAQYGLNVQPDRPAAHPEESIMP